MGAFNKDFDSVSLHRPTTMGLLIVFVFVCVFSSVSSHANIRASPRAATVIKTGSL